MEKSTTQTHTHPYINSFERERRRRKEEKEEKTNTAKTVKLQNECDKGIVMQAHVFVIVGNILDPSLSLFFYASTDYQLNLIENPIQKILQTTCQNKRDASEIISTATPPLPSPLTTEEAVATVIVVANKNTEIIREKGGR